MPGRSACAVLAAYALPLVEAKYSWYLSAGASDCTEACRDVGATCVPAQLPADAVEMQSLAMEARHVCDNIRRVVSTTMEKFAPAFDPPVNTPQGEVAGGTCWYPQSTQYSTCSEDLNTRTGAEKLMQRFCACSEVETLQWLVSNPGQNCDATCTASGGMCANVGGTIWPMDQHAMADVIANAGVACNSVGFGETNAAPSYSSTGKCHWSKHRGSGVYPSCSTSEQGVRRFCPCYDVVRS